MYVQLLYTFKLNESRKELIEKAINCKLKFMKKITKYIISSTISTALDLSIFIALNIILTAHISHLVGYSIGMICNYTIQKNIFSNKIGKINNTHNNQLRCG